MSVWERDIDRDIERVKERERTWLLSEKQKWKKTARSAEVKQTPAGSFDDVLKKLAAICKNCLLEIAYYYCYQMMLLLLL